jgi:GDP-mannose 6-dehydrogenase
MKSKIETLSIFGLGYVGCVSAACLARNGTKIIGVDKNPEKVHQISEGKSPIVEPQLESLIQDGVKNSDIIATVDFEKAIKESDACLICVGTPSLEDGHLDMIFIEKVTQEIATTLQNSQDSFVLIYRSTLEPGTIEGLVLPILNDVLEQRVGKDIQVVYQPEFLREGSAIKDFYTPGKTVLAGTSEEAIDAVLALYPENNSPVFRTEIRIAELVKMIDNVFHALKVSFGNEVGAFCKKLGIDSHELMKIFLADTQLNISTKYLTPGKPFGGSCLPKDLRALKRYSLEMSLNLPIINNILESNELRVEEVLQKIIKFGKKRISFLGLSFKENTDDVRESPAIYWVERLLGKGYEIKIYDSQINYLRLIGGNKAHIDHHLPHITQLLVNNIDELFDNCDCLVITNEQAEYFEFCENLKKDIHVLDLAGMYELKNNNFINYQGLYW